MDFKTVDIPRGFAFRVQSLEWYAKGASPAGSRIRSGRFNAHGRSALYLAMDYNTAFEEYFGGNLPTPAVLLPFEIEALTVVDLRGKLGKWDAHWRDWESDWTVARDLAEAQVAAGSPVTATCSSWQCGDEAIARKCGGILFPSTKRKGGENLVLFLEDATLGSIHCAVHDPQRDIAKANPPDRGRKPRR